ncbi:hypothetical protein FRZ61_52020 [Hypericibacter adhaerens]|uniref:Glycosyltransferase 2-like domain-containing protein n=1 Tax=Hypericibacter adhaerens TaxID=2602016 RepID=A0A5J6N805_9PROT|nr:glycosyltransferase [Hypericibacter adhaerens]QEX25255.1 hypothetical protein FRZ61_52020 [Hypericibacter adhaerens]
MLDAPQSTAQASRPPTVAIKVADLIADTVWSPGGGHGTASPELSILLPTFRRGADGLLQRAIESICRQSFRDFELIVVDDASTDGSAEIVRNWMARDGRISCLTHPRNIGLPAVSELEAYLKSRGKFIGFAFDDFIYEPGAFEALVAAARANPDSLVHGYVQMVGWSGVHRVLGQELPPYAQLWQENFIANASVLMPRQIVETIGFYDPHIMATRNCDWDLWRRVQRRFPIVPIPAFIGREFGSARSDSLGSTYPVFQDVMSEFYGSRDDATLLPSRLPDRDVWALPEKTSFALAAATINVRKFFKDKSWARKAQIADDADQRRLTQSNRPIIGVAGSLDAMTSLCFDALRDRFGGELRFIDLRAPQASQTRHLLFCDALIVAGMPFEDRCRHAMAVCKNFGIDVYQLADEDPIRPARGSSERAPSDPDDVKQALQVFKGVLAISPALVERYKANALHANLRLLGPAFDRATMDKAHRVAVEPHLGKLRIGLTDDGFRRKSLQDSLYPALLRLSQHRDVELVATAPSNPGADGWAPPPSPVASRSLPRASSYDAFIQGWRALGIDLLVHPEGTSLDIDHKAPGLLLTALYLGAVPVVCDEAAFHGIGEDDGVLKAAPGAANLVTVLEGASDPDRRVELLRRLERFCVKRFDPEASQRVLQSICEATRPADALSHQARLHSEYARLFYVADQAAIQLNSRAFKLAMKLRRLVNLARHAGRALLGR